MAWAASIVRMAISEKALKRARDFFSTSLKAKQRFASLKAFQEYACELEQVEFFEEHAEKLLFFVFECYAAAVNKFWVRVIEDGKKEKDRPPPSLDEAVQFAFGIPNPDGLFDSVSSAATLARSVDSNEPATASVHRLCELFMRVKSTDSSSKAAYESALRKDASSADFLRFPVVFNWLLKYNSGTLLIDSPLSLPLVLLVKRLLHTANAPAMRIEGLRMLLSLIKISSYLTEGSASPRALCTKRLCISVYDQLIDIDALLAGNEEPKPELEDSEPLLRGKYSLTALSFFNEVFAFMTWDVNADLHSSRFLYQLLRDRILVRLYARAWKWAQGREDLPAFALSAEEERALPLKLQGLIVDYLGLWLLKSSSSSTLRSHLQQGTAVDGAGSGGFSLAIADLTSLLGLKSSAAASNSSVLRAKSFDGHDVPVASFLMEEIIMHQPADVRFVHLILRVVGAACMQPIRGDCGDDSFSAKKSVAGGVSFANVRLELECFRSWVFNPPSRRPAFLADPVELERHLFFYVAALRDLFPYGPDYVLGPNYEALEVQREALYFYRAMSLQAFVPLSIGLWEELLGAVTSIAEACLLSETPLCNEALLVETLLGCLIRAGEAAVRESASVVSGCWKRVAAVLTQAGSVMGKRVVVEEWCRVAEALALLLVRDPLYLMAGKKQNALALSLPLSERKQREGSVKGRSSLSPSLSTSSSGSSSASASYLASPSAMQPLSPVLSMSSSASTSAGALPPAMVSFSAWPDLLGVRRSALFLFRNVLRLLGDFGGRASELCARGAGTVVVLGFSALERIVCTLLRCRQGQAVRIGQRQVPPLLDVLIPALSLLTQLKAVPEDESVTLARILAWRMVGRLVFRPSDFVVPERYWAALILAVQETFQRDLGDGGGPAVSPTELATIVEFIGAPLASLCPSLGCSLACLEPLLDGLIVALPMPCNVRLLEDRKFVTCTLRFISNAFQVCHMFPSRLSRFRDPFARGLPSLLRLLGEKGGMGGGCCADVLISGITSLLQCESIHSEPAEAEDDLLDALLQLLNCVMLSRLGVALRPQASSGSIKSPLSGVEGFSPISMEDVIGGSESPLSSVSASPTFAEVEAIVSCFLDLSVAYATIPRLQATLFGGTARLPIVLHALVDVLAAALSLAANSREAVLLSVRLMQEVLPSWFLYALPAEYLQQSPDVRTHLLHVLMQRSGLRASAEDEVVKVLDMARVHWMGMLLCTLGLPLRPLQGRGERLPLAGSPRSIGKSWLLHAALSPVRVLLSFGVAGGKLVVLMRTALGAFEWSFEPVHGSSVLSTGKGKKKAGGSAEAKTAAKSGNAVPIEQVLRAQVVTDEEFAEAAHALQKEQTKDCQDQLRAILDDLARRFGECQLRAPRDEDVAEVGWKEQAARESEFVSRHFQQRELWSGSPESFAATDSPGGEGSEMFKGSGWAMLLIRSLFASTGLVLPELAGASGSESVEMLLEGSAVNGDFERDLEGLDSMPTRRVARLAALFIAPHVEGSLALGEDADLLNSVSTADGEERKHRTDYDGFLAELACKVASVSEGQSLDGAEDLSHFRLETPVLDISVLDSEAMAGSYLDRKRHLGNCSVLIVWHATAGSWSSRNPLRSEVTEAIVHILPVLPGQWYLVSRQLNERFLAGATSGAGGHMGHDRGLKKVDGFAALSLDSIQDLSNDYSAYEAAGLRSAFDARNVDGAGVLVPRGALGAIVRGLALAIEQECTMNAVAASSLALKLPAISISSSSSNLSTSADAKLVAQSHPVQSRMDRIEALISKYRVQNLTYDQFLSRLFK